MLRRLFNAVFCGECIAPKVHPTHIFHKMSGWHD